MTSRRTPDGTASPVASLETDEQSAHRLADLVAASFDAENVAVSLVDSGAGRWRVAIHSRAPDARMIRQWVAAAAGPGGTKSLRFERVAARDWVRASLAGLKPVTAGRFIVHGAHDRARIPLNRIGIEIEAALAFGTGHHGTTRGCLLALDRIRKGPHAGFSRKNSDPRILDLGTGSGVLAIAAARALRRRVLATDNDAQAVRAARANAACNGVGALVEIVKADGVTAQRVREAAPFDLIFANILLRPLQRFAVPLQRLAAPGARVVLSGLLPSQANAAIAAYHGLALQRRIELDGWTTLVFARPTRRRSSVARRRPAS